MSVHYQLGRWHLRFADPAEEQAFLAYHAERAVPFIRVGMVASMMGWVIGHIGIALAMPEVLRMYNIGVFGVMYPLIALLFFLSFVPYTSRILQTLSMLANVAAGAVIALMTQIASFAPLALSAFILILFIGIVAFRLRVQQTLVLAVLNVALYEAVLLNLFLSDAKSLQQLVMESVVLWIAAGMVLLVAYVIETTTRQSFAQERLIAEQQEIIRLEKAKADNLLLNILPESIAALLKDEPKTIAQHHEHVSILFADIVNFTPLSAQMPPAETVDLLNNIFSYFDTLAEKYALEKIKTIGDCYMIAAGVPRPRTDHAQALANMALEIQDYASQHKFSGRQLAFRIGINSGPVVAGVIGHRKFIYDLWGDTVNTASRMESHGVAGSIQVTDATHELIKRDFICEPRGIVNVKGKGEVKVWYVLAKKA